MCVCGGKSTLVLVIHYSDFWGWGKEAYRLFGAGWSLADSAGCADGGLGAVRLSSLSLALTCSVVSLCCLGPGGDRRIGMEQLNNRMRSQHLLKSFRWHRSLSVPHQENRDASQLKTGRKKMILVIFSL